MRYRLRLIPFLLNLPVSSYIIIDNMRGHIMIISGKEISTKIKDQLKEEVEQMKNKYDRLPKLAVILVGENQASQVYVRNKERGCSYVGMDSLKITHDATFSEEELLNEIKQLNEDDTVDGILVQLPLRIISMKIRF